MKEKRGCLLGSCILFLFIGGIMLIVGCNEDSSGFCENNSQENSIVKKHKIDEDICHYSTEYSTVCYRAYIKVKYDNTTCEIYIDNYSTEEKAEQKLDKNYPIGSSVKIVADGKTCSIKEESKALIIAALIILSFSGIFLLLLILSFCTFKKVESENRENLIP